MAPALFSGRAPWLLRRLAAALLGGRAVWQLALLCPQLAAHSPDRLRRAGWLWTPTGITLAGDRLYVLEHLRMPLAILGDLAIGPYLRVRIVSGDGNVTELARMWGRNTGIAASAVALVIAVITGALYFRRRRAAG